MKTKLSSLEELLEEIDKKDGIQRDRGTMFENVSLVYFKNEPMYKQRFSDVWLLKDVPNEYGIPKIDVGVDLVAKERITGDLVAIQCKYYAPSTIIQKGHIDSFLNEIGKRYFSSGIIVASSPRWSSNAESALKDRDKKIARIGFEDLLNSHIDWSHYSPSKAKAFAPLKPAKKPRQHQVEAIEAVLEGFKENNRGKLIMAPGTGKTYTSLQIAENLAKEKEGQFRVLYLVPSIQLLSQSLRGWTGDSIYANDMNTIAVCSDRNVTRKESESIEFDISVADIGYPATTNFETLLEYKKDIEANNIDNKFLVVFSTYQSIEVISQAQKEGFYEFDLIIADEAHRTTGATKLGEDGSAFVKVHDNNLVKSERRLYQTATPRVFGDNAKSKADEMSVVIADMDDESTYGPEFFRLGFGKAVHSGILTDYKVMVLAVDETMVQKQMQRIFSNKENELEFDDVTKIIGCWNGLLKRKNNSNRLAGQPMKRAIAFTNTIANSKLITNMWQTVVDEYIDQDNSDAFQVQIDHADGSMNALQKNQKINWLKSEVPDKTCRILSNARFLTEGVDVPDLDAVMFLNPRKSKIDIAQAVGRVMRKHPGKEYGYVILPIGVPSGESANQVLDNNERYRVVWDVLNALRSIDERFDATINKLELNKRKPDTINVIGVNGGAPEVNEDDGEYIVEPEVEQLTLEYTEEEWSALEHAIYGKIVDKVGNTRYWETWSKDVTEIAQQHITRIHAMLESEPATERAFNKFLKGLRHNINDSISVDEAVEMLAQHMITKPVFDALFEEESFALNNPISQAMDLMIDELVTIGLNKEQEQLEGFYESVRIRAEGIDNLEAKQTIIVQLYEKFFKVGFPSTTDRLGIVFTPVEVVDFIIHSVEDALQKHLGKSISDRNVNVLDPFTGTGTFITRLLQSGLINQEDLLYKYTNEIFANEIVLLSYYIAAINIEETFKEVSEIDEYHPFEGIVLTDTFKSTEQEATLDSDMFETNNDRLVRQKEAPVTVIVGNPPYNVGQGTGNISSIQTEYSKLDNSIKETYEKFTTGRNKKLLRDSYIRAFRWASNRITERGVIGFITNGSFIDSSITDGLRKCWHEEFNYIYVFNLRGNARTSGEQRRKEAGNIFNYGSRAPIAITVLVKDGSDNHEVFYKDIGDYLTREQKFEIIENSGSINKMEWEKIIPDENNDWINQQNKKFQKFTSIFGEKDSVFITKNPGIKSHRDNWVYNFSKENLDKNVNYFIDNYNRELDRFEKNVYKDYSNVSKDEHLIKWSAGLRNLFKQGRKISYEENDMTIGMIRPFTKKYLYFNDDLVEMTRNFNDKIDSDTITIYISSNPNQSFSCLAIQGIPNIHTLNTGQGFSYSNYDLKGNLFDDSVNISGDFSEKIGLSKMDVFYYVYGILHSKSYNNKYDNDLKKEYPRIPIVNNKEKFVRIGKKLMDLHLNYEGKEVPEDLGIIFSTQTPSYRVQKMKFGKGKDKTKIIFNKDITVRNIPEKAYEYMVNGRSAIEWIIDQYQVKTDRKSGITEDPNEYSEDPKYIFNLLLSIINVSVQTVDLVNSLPPLEIIEE